MGVTDACSQSLGSFPVLYAVFVCVVLYAVFVCVVLYAVFVCVVL